MCDIDPVFFLIAHLWTFHMVNSVTCMNVGTSLEKANKIVFTKL